MPLSTFLPAAAIGNAAIAVAWSALGAFGREELSLAMLVALVVPVALVWGVVRSRWSAVRPEPPPSA
jgi:membrane protein DedA with SNARE-associated domain